MPSRIWSCKSRRLPPRNKGDASSIDGPPPALPTRASAPSPVTARPIALSSCLASAVWLGDLQLRTAMVSKQSRAASTDAQGLLPASVGAGAMDLTAGGRGSAAEGSEGAWRLVRRMSGCGARLPVDGPTSLPRCLSSSSSSSGGAAGSQHGGSTADCKASAIYLPVPVPVSGGGYYEVTLARYRHGMAWDGPTWGLQRGNSLPLVGSLVPPELLHV